MFKTIFILMLRHWKGFKFHFDNAWKVCFFYLGKVLELCYNIYWFFIYKPKNVKGVTCIVLIYIFTDCIVYTLAVPDAAAGSINGHGPWSRWCVRRTNSRPWKAKTHSAAAGPAAPRTQMPAARAGKRRDEGLYSASLPHHEERTQSHDPLPGRQVLPGWV